MFLLALNSLGVEVGGGFVKSRDGVCPNWPELCGGIGMGIGGRMNGG